MSQYYAPKGGLPPQSQIMTDRAVFTDSYAVIPRGTMTDIVTWPRSTRSVFHQ